MKVAVYGSCVARDTVEFAPDMESVGYIARQSFISATTPRVEPPGMPDLESYWQKRMVLDDVTSRGLDMIVEAGRVADVVLFDLVDEREGVLVVGDQGYVTNTGELLKSGMRAKLAPAARIHFGTDEHFELWRASAARFADRLRSEGILQKAVVLHTKFASRDEYGNRIAEYGTFSHDEWNNAYSRYFDQLRALGFAVYEMPDNVIAYSEHKWGVAPYHYHPDVYADVVTAIRKHTGRGRREGPLHRAADLLQRSASLLRIARDAEDVDEVRRWLAEAQECIDGPREPSPDNNID